MNQKQQRPFARPERFKTKFVIMLFGIIIQGLGLSFLIRINLGTDPCSVFTLGINHYLPISFGTCQLLCHLINFLIVVIFNRGLISFGTIGNMCCLGYVVDFFSWIWNSVFPETFFDGMIVRYSFLVPALIVFILGAALYMSADLGVSPYDGVPFILSQHCKKFSFQVVRMTWDISYMVVGFLLGGPVGIVTIAVAFFLGPVIGVVKRSIEKMWAVNG